MTGKAITLLLLAAIVAVAAVAVVAMSSEDGPDPVVDPDDPVSNPLPKGISFDEKTGMLKSKSEVTWYVTDELQLFEERVQAPKTSAVYELKDPGLYTVAIVSGTQKIDLVWDQEYADSNKGFNNILIDSCRGAMSITLHIPGITAPSELYVLANDVSSKVKHMNVDIVATCVSTQNDSPAVIDILIADLSELPSKFVLTLTDNKNSSLAQFNYKFQVTVEDSSFRIIVDGTQHLEANWDYYFKGQLYDVSVAYDIDIRELSKITLENRKYNDIPPNTAHPFSELPKQVYVNETVRSIVSQLEARFVEIGGDLEDKQSFADFLISFAQLGIKYPVRVDNSTDKLVWGQSEYWASSLETMFFMKGDCDDSAAVACALLKAAGFKTAMAGIPGHVAAGVVIDAFKEVSEDTLSKIITSHRTKGITVSSIRLCVEPSVIQSDPQDVLYYGVETTKGQLPVGYMLNSSADSLNKSTMWWGMAGFYPVSSN